MFSLIVHGSNYIGWFSEEKKTLYGQKCPKNTTFNRIDRMLLHNTHTDIKINVEPQSLLHKYSDKLLTNKQTNKLSNTNDDSPASPNETDRLSNRQPDNQTDIHTIRQTLKIWWVTHQTEGSGLCQYLMRQNTVKQTNRHSNKNKYSHSWKNIGGYSTDKYLVLAHT